MEKIGKILEIIDEIVWGPAMLILMVGTGIFLTVRTRCLPWRNLWYALKNTLSKEAREVEKGSGDISPFSALTTALAATIGTGNIVGVATAMVSGGPGALVWMWVSALFGMSSKFSECMLSIKYREVNERGEMSGGPMYTMKNAFKHKRVGAVMGWLFALFAVLASFGIGNMTQGNSISAALNTAFNIPYWKTGFVITVFALIILVGGIKSISKVSQVVVPAMAVFYVLAAFIVIFGNIANLPSGICQIFKMAFSLKAVTGGTIGTVVASMAKSMRFGVARGCFSNEAGMGSAAITAAAAVTDSPVKQGYINMTGTFWDTIVVCTITGLCIACSGVLGDRDVNQGTYSYSSDVLQIRMEESSNDKTYNVVADYGKNRINLSDKDGTIVLKPYKDTEITSGSVDTLLGGWKDESGNVYTFSEGGVCTYEELLVGSSLTIAAFESVLGKAGGWIVSIAIVLFAFSTILGWEYHGEKAFEYLLGTPAFNIIYRIVFAVIIYLGATTALEVVWSFSDIANALMAIPNLICLLVLSKEIANDMFEYQKVIDAEKSDK